MPQLYTYARFFPPYFSCPFCRFSILVFLSFSFIFSTPSWKWRPTLFVLELRHLFLWSSGHSVQKNCQIVEEVWTMTEQVVKSKDLRRQTREWKAFFHKLCEKYYRKSCKYMRNNSTKQKGKKISTSHYRSKFWAQQYGDKSPKKAGKPWREKCGTPFMQAWCQKDLPTVYQRRTCRQTHVIWTPRDHLDYRRRDNILWLRFARKNVTLDTLRELVHSIPHRLENVRKHTGRRSGH